MLIMYLVRKTHEQEPFLFWVCHLCLHAENGGGGGGWQLRGVLKLYTLLNNILRLGETLQVFVFHAGES